MKINRKIINKPSNRIHIEIDSMPITLNPLLANDYNSKFILSTMYEPLIHQKNCSITQLDDLTFNVQINPNYIGDAFLLLEVIKFHLDLKNKSPYFKELLFIKNALGIYKKSIGIEHLGISIINKKQFVLNLEYKIDYFEELLKSLFLTPINPYILEENGPYKFLSKSSNNISVIINQQYCRDVSLPVSEITFMVNRDIHESITLFQNGINDITCNTQFLHENLHYKSYEDFCENDLTLIYLLSTKNKELTKFLYNHFPREKVSKRLNGIVIPLYNFIDWDRTGSIIENKNTFYSKVPLQLNYAQFYPNNLVIKELCELLSNNQIPFNINKSECFDDFLNGNLDYDIKLSLIIPTFNHYSSLMKPLIYEYPKETQIQIVTAINNQHLNTYKHHFQMTEFSLPLLKGKSIYLKEPSIKGYFINELGLLDVSNLTYL